MDGEEGRADAKRRKGNEHDDGEEVKEEKAVTGTNETKEETNKEEETVKEETKKGKKETRLRNAESRRAKVPLAAWDETQQLAWIVENRGKHVNRMGFFVNQKQWLLPEETAFLVSDGEMDLAKVVSTTTEEAAPPEYEIIDDLATAFALSYQGLARHKVALVDYYTFVALKKLRFNVFRTGEWAIDHCKLISEATSGPEFKLSIPAGETDTQGVEKRVVLRYDAYSPQSNFNTVLRSTPPFQVATTRPGDRVPPVRDMREVAKECSEKGTKLRVALFDGQGVSFVQVEDFNLQNIRAAFVGKPVTDGQESEDEV